eukprot:g8268.t1
MNDTDYELIVIGTGPAGSSVARAIREQGRRVAIIEERPFGGTCALRGCNPKKVYANAGHLMAQINGAQGRLVSTENARIDWSNLAAFKREFTDSIPEKSRRSFEDDGIDTIQGTARLTGPQTIQVGDRTLTAERIFVAVGAQPAPLDIPGGEQTIDSDAFMELDTLPPRVCFIGGGYVAMEFAHVALRAGREVTVVERDSQILNGFDPDLTQQLADYSREQGLTVHTGSEVTRIDTDGDGLQVVFETDGDAQTVPCDLVVRGAGRIPRLEPLDPAAANLKTGKDGIEVDPYLRSTSNPHVFAAGDCAATGRPKLTPTANEEARAAVENLFDSNPSFRPDYGSIPRVAFTTPSIAAVGLSEEEARREHPGLSVRSGNSSDWTSIRKSGLDCAGYKVMVSEDDQILGAHLLGHAAEETINLFALAMKFNLTASNLKSTLFTFPTAPSQLSALSTQLSNEPNMTVEKSINQFMEGLKHRNPHEDEFHQAVHEVVASVMPWYLQHDEYRKAQILERVTEPDRIIIFRVSWQTDDGSIRANRAWRVQFNNALGPYKGGLRFHKSVDQSVLKFLGFEQVFKNSLTGLPMGGAKGGSNFNPANKSEDEVMRFCQSLMTELHRHIGEDVDIPAGDIGVGSREISFLFGQYMRLANRWSGVLTGKGCSFGGSAVRTEATGFGCVYFCEHMLNQHGEQLEGKSVAVSGSGNVARYAAEKLIEKGARVLTLSDSDGFVHIKDGLTEEQLAFVHELKEQRRGRIEEFAYKFDGVEFHADATPWGIDCDVAMPCATQNELQEADARALIDNKVFAVCEGANMPTTEGAAERFENSDVLHAPGKASNAGGVAVSGLEMSQNAMRVSWSRDDVDERLQSIMKEIHDQCVEFGGGEDRVNYTRGANIAGFRKVAQALSAYGVH